MQNRGILTVISGFSGVGKGAIVKKLVESYDNYVVSISATTRAPRPGDTNGVDYFFLNKRVFEEKIAAGGFIEYAYYCGQYYGTPKDYVERQLDAGKDVILEIETQGALTVKQQFPNTLLFFIMPPNAQELVKRLESRGTETPQVVTERLKNAVYEAEEIEKYDYILINDDLDVCVRRLHEIIMTAHNIPERNKNFIEKIRTELKDLAEGGV
ncbi:MAG: guanylate kinase [Lachnospiraceae bacterium]|nr:guanylate kinase [Lachnospiraceae bacterium]